MTFALVMLTGLFALNAHVYWIGSQMPVTTDDRPATDTRSRVTWRIRRRPLSGPAFARPSTSGADISTLPKSLLV